MRSRHCLTFQLSVDLGSGSQREVDDIMLTRYAPTGCAKRRPKKQEIAFAQPILPSRPARRVDRAALLDSERLAARMN